MAERTLDQSRVGHTLTAQAFVGYLGRCRFQFGTEDDLQAGISGLLLSQGIAHRREVRLTPRDRIDFLFEGGLGVEVKIDGPTASLVRQLARYAASTEVSEFAVVTSRRRHVLELPAEAGGKPVAVAYVGSAAL